jgi:phosphatidylglycerophosphate synthase
MMRDIRSHQRVLDTFTGPWERPALRWLAAHMPPWVTPDLLTAVGVLGGLIIFSGYWLTGLNRNFLWLVNLGFVINWVGDSLDGTLARYRHIERPVYGFYIDHVVDAYVEIMIVLGLGLSPYVRFDLACLALIGYLLLSVLVYVRTCVKGEFVISYGKLGPTEVRLIIIAANILVFIIGNPTLTLGSLTLSIYDWLVILILFIMYTIAILTTATQARQLARLDAEQKKKLAGLPGGESIQNCKPGA